MVPEPLCAREPHVQRPRGLPGARGRGRAGAGARAHRGGAAATRRCAPPTAWAEDGQLLQVVQPPAPVPRGGDRRPRPRGRAVRPQRERAGGRGGRRGSSTCEPRAHGARHPAARLGRRLRDGGHHAPHRHRRLVVSAADCATCWRVRRLSRRPRARRSPSCRCATPTTPSGSASTCRARTWSGRCATGATCWTAPPRWTCPRTGRARPWPANVGRSHALPPRRGAARSGVREACRQQAATLNMVLLAAFAETLRRYSGQDDLVVGTLLGSRSRPELEPIVGMFVNSAALRLRLPGDATFRDAVAAAQARRAGRQPAPGPAVRKAGGRAGRAARPEPPPPLPGALLSPRVR